MSNLVYEDDKHTILVIEKGFQVSKDKNIIWTSFDAFFEQHGKIDNLEQKLADQQKLLDEAVELAKFYGNYDNHIHPTSKDTCLTAIDKDAGEKARNFIEKVNG